MSGSAAAEDPPDSPAERRVGERGRGAIGGGGMRGRRRRFGQNFEHLRWLRSKGGDTRGGALCAQRGHPVGGSDLAAALRKHVAQGIGPIVAAAVAQRREEERLHFAADRPSQQLVHNVVSFTLTRRDSNTPRLASQ